jgi:carbonic anhydrase
MFIHRNIANQVIHTDLSCQSVMQYAVFGLGVEEIVVCGHYGCGGVKAAMGEEDANGIVDNWIRGIKSLNAEKAEEIHRCSGEDAQADRLCELNVVRQVVNAAESPVVQQAWKEGRKLTVHGLIYGLADGKLTNLEVSVSSAAELAALAK